MNASFSSREGLLGIRFPTHAAPPSVSQFFSCAVTHVNYPRFIQQASSPVNVSERACDNVACPSLTYASVDLLIAPFNFSADYHGLRSVTVSFLSSLFSIKAHYAKHAMHSRREAVNKADVSIPTVSAPSSFFLVSKRINVNRHNSCEQTLLLKSE